MYALSVDIWMVILSRSILGTAIGLMMPSAHTYIGEMGSVLDHQREDQGKKPRKFVLYIAYSFIINGGHFIAFGE